MRDGNIQMGGCGRPEQPRRAANDIAVMLQVASGRHQWPNNQLFAWPAITYQLAEWLSGLSIGPSRLSVLLGTRRCGETRTPAGLPLYLEAKTRQGPSDFGQEEVNPTGDAGTVLEHPASTKKGLQKQEDYQLLKYSQNRLLYRSIKL